MRSILVLITSIGMLFVQSALAGEMVRYEHTMTVAAKSKHQVQQKQIRSNVERQDKVHPYVHRIAAKKHRLSRRSEPDRYSQKNSTSAMKNRG